MANVDKPFGYRPIGTLSGSPWQASVRAFQLDATHTLIGVGDLVNMTSDGYVNRYAAGGTQVIGVMVGVLPIGLGWNATSGMIGDNFLSATEPTLTGASHNSVALNTAGSILVTTAPDLIMVVQEDGDTTPLTLADIGLNIETTDTAVDSTTGMSKQELDSSSAATTNTLPLRLLALHPEPGNELASVDTTKPWTKWQGTFANHSFKGLNVGV